jgi:hypothetical protein
MPSVSLDEASVVGWERLFDRWLRTEGALTLYRDASTRLVSRPGETEREFRLRSAQAGRESRDTSMEKLRSRSRTKIETGAS